MAAEPRSPARSAARLEELLMVGAPIKHLSDLGHPQYLDLVFHIVLCKLVRLGAPGPRDKTLTPAHLIRLAESAANAGLTPPETPGMLRDNLVQLGLELRDSGAWADEQPLPWEPLPGPGQSEQRLLLFRKHCFQDLNLTSAFMSDGKRFQVVPGFLPRPLLDEVAAELERAYEKGLLRMDRAGVGKQEHLAEVRTDRVCYLSGLEPGLAQAAPNLVALLRVLLNEGAAGLATSSDQKPLFPPLSAMLARYESPSAGYHPHMDNPGGDADNGRTRTLTLYLSNPEKERLGGDLAIWHVGCRTNRPPDQEVPPTPGSAVIFDSRAIPHQVTPLQAGPPRWALALWFNDTPQKPHQSRPRPRPQHVLLATPNPPLAPGRLLFHELDDRSIQGRLTLHLPGPRPRVGLVSTVYRAGAYLETWCEHHFAAGVDQLILVFDHLEEAEEAGCAQRLAARFSDRRLDIRAGTQVRLKDWPNLPDDPRLADCRRFAGSGSSSQAVAARQMLNASAVLLAARKMAEIDWLLHLDGDELLVPCGPGRGGSNLHDCFAAADRGGFQLLRFVNHELLRLDESRNPRFKRNPRLAAARLGPAGWGAIVDQLGLAQDGPRPWFTGYFNGKSAVAVAAGALAAGVHGWYLNQPAHAGNSAFLAGPHVLHCHLSSPESFRQKFLAISNAKPVPNRLFVASPVEEAALALIEKSRGAGLSSQELNKALEDLHHRLTFFSPNEQSLLEEAELLMEFPDVNVAAMLA